MKIKNLHFFKKKLICIDGLKQKYVNFEGLCSFKIT